MRRKLILILTFALLLPAASASAQDSFQSLGRYLGFGWGDGIHAKQIWHLSSGPTISCASAVRPTPTPAAPIKNEAPRAEPNSPSDLPAAKTSMRRYPRR